MSRRELKDLPPFEAGGKTLFLYDTGRKVWIISAWDGSEAEVPPEDLEEWVETARSFLDEG